jgi:hypothetical protein
MSPLPFSSEKGGRGRAELQKMPLNIFWSKLLKDDDECIVVFLPR